MLEIIKWQECKILMFGSFFQQIQRSRNLWYLWIWCIKMDLNCTFIDAQFLLVSLYRSTLKRVLKGRNKFFAGVIV